jgi:hypothetical protein
MGAKTTKLQRTAHSLHDASSAADKDREDQVTAKVIADARRHQCVCVNSTPSTLSLSPPADTRVPGAVFSGHLGAAVTKIKDATPTSPSTWGRPLALLHPTTPKSKVQPIARAHLVCSPCRFQ